MNGFERPVTVFHNWLQMIDELSQVLTGLRSTFIKVVQPMEGNIQDVLLEASTNSEQIFQSFRDFHGMIIIIHHHDHLSLTPPAPSDTFQYPGGLLEWATFELGLETRESNKRGTWWSLLRSAIRWIRYHQSRRGRLMTEGRLNNQGLMFVYHMSFEQTLLPVMPCAITAAPWSHECGIQKPVFTLILNMPHQSINSWKLLGAVIAMRTHDEVWRTPSPWLNCNGSLTERECLAECDGKQQYSWTQVPDWTATEIWRKETMTNPSNSLTEIDGM